VDAAKVWPNDIVPSTRFLHVGTQSTDRSMLYVFGGQHSTDETTAGVPGIKHALRMNDVWQFDIIGRRWTNLFESQC